MGEIFLFFDQNHGVAILDDKVGVLTGVLATGPNIVGILGVALPLNLNNMFFGF